MEKKVIRLYDDNSISNILNILEWLAEDIDDEDDKPTNKVEPKKVEPKKTASKVIKDVRPDVGTSYTKKDEKNFKPLFIPKIKDVMFRDPATIVWFEDGSKTVAVAGHGDVYDKEIGLAVCMLKRVLGNKEYRAIMDKWCYSKKVLN